MKKAVRQSVMVSIFSIGSILLLFGVLATFVINAFFTKQRMNANMDRFELTYNANRFMNGSAYLTNEVRAYAATGQQEHYDNYWNEVNNLKNRDIGVANLKEIGITEEEQTMIDEMSALSNELVPLEDQAMENVKSGNKAAAIDYVYGEEYSKSIARINEIKAQFLEKLDNRASAQVEHLSDLCDRMTAVVWTLILSVMVLQLISNLYNRKRVLRPVIRIQKEMSHIAQGELSSDFELKADTSEVGLLIDAIHKTKETLKRYIGDISDRLAGMAQGDMSQRIEVDYIGDFAPIRQALTTILDALNSTLSQIELSSAQVSSSSRQVAQGAQDLSQGASEQAASVEHISTSVGQISEQMRRITDNAGRANQISNEASGTLHLSNEKMEELLQAMQEISNASMEIGKIIDTIESIAFQTNILALNAAVEAARAGEAGKGFAVVADEVRSLANKSQKASGDTAALIERTLKAVDNGIRLADDTARTLGEVVEGARQSTVLVEEISKHSESQAEALSRLTSGIERVSNVIQTNSATAEESAAAAEELSAQAVTLQQLIEVFKLRERK